MRKSIKSLCAAAVVIAVALSLCLIPGSGNSAEAAVIRQTVMTDDFNAPSLSSDWTASGGAQLDNEFASLRLIRPDVWQPAVMLQREETRVSGARTITFEIKLVSGASWLGIVLGSPAPTSAFYEAKTMLMVSDTTVGLWETDGAQNLIENAAASLTDSPMTAASADRVSVKLELTPTGETDSNRGELYGLKLSWGARDAETLKKEYAVYAEDYFGFCGQAGLIIDIFDFKMTDGEGKTIFEDDFTAPSISYPSGADSSADWRVTHLYESDRVYMGYQRHLGFSGTDAKAVSGVLLAADTRCENAYEIAFDLTFSQPETDTLFGVGLGLSDENAAIDSSAFIGFKKTGASKVQAVLVKNGTVTEGITSPADVSDTVRVVVRGYYDGRADVVVGGATRAKLEGIACGGYAALGILNMGGEGCAAGVDNFELSSYTYEAADTPDCGQDFAGVKEFEDFGDTYYEHYINTKRWFYLGAGVSFPVRYNQKYLLFSDASGTAAFGLKNKYSEYILRFDVKSTVPNGSTKKVAPVGVSVGRRFIDSDITESAAVLFTDAGGSMTVSCLGGEGAAVTVPLNFYRDSETTYNVMMIVAGRSVKVYFKAERDDISEMGILRAEFTNINTFGYAAVTCDTRDGRVGNFQLTNFSVTNIEPSL